MQRSVDLTDWRQQLCLQMNLYDLDVTGQQAKLLPDELQSWESYEDNSNANDGNISDWLQEGMALSQLHRCLDSVNYVGLSWIDLENYEGMQNLIAACLQSLPTVILNSVLFSSGNNPSHGIFLSSNLFVAAIVASFLAMLKTLMELLWQASRRDMHPMRHAASLVVGKTLAGDATQSKLGTRSGRVELPTLQYLETPPLGDPAQPSKKFEAAIELQLSLSNPKYSFHATTDNTSSEV
ncbi:TPA: hypothetical protein ACH3X1_005828 [Trebouxia sp. C0004]